LPSTLPDTRSASATELSKKGSQASLRTMTPEQRKERSRKAVRTSKLLAVKPQANSGCDG
jgi:hypothetical protein